MKTVRGQLGVDHDERICDFKSDVLKKAIKEINKHTNIKIRYEQEKCGKILLASNLKYY